MNRNTAIFLALFMLLAHALSIHRDYRWHFAGPFDQSCVAFAVAEQIDLPEADRTVSLEAYPSPLWVGLAWVARWAGLSAPLVAQMAGVLLALVLLSASTRIAWDRVAGVIPPLLLVLSGTMAAGSVSGTEHMALACFAMLALVAFEKGRTRWLVAATVALAATRAETLLLVAPFSVFQLVDRIKGRGKRRHPWWTLLPAAAVFAIFAFYTPPGSAEGLYLSNWKAGLASQETQQGLAYLRDFVVVAITPMLLAISAGFLLFGWLSGVGIRALILCLFYGAWLVRTGGDVLPFGLAYLPILPLMCLVIQETIVAALDTYRPSMEAASWIVLFMTAFASASASKFPGDVGPLSLERSHLLWLTPKQVLPLGQDPILARTQLHSEIRKSFLMDLLATRLEPFDRSGERILSPWNGHLTWRSNMQVLDWFGRLTPAGEHHALPLASIRGTHLARALEQRPEWVMPAIGLGNPYRLDHLQAGINPHFFQLSADPEADQAAIGAILEKEYVLHALPLQHPALSSTQPYLLYCRKDLAQAPVLRLEREDGSLVLEAVGDAAKPRPLPCMVDLQVVGIDAQGEKHPMAPDGTFLAPGTALRTGTSLVLEDVREEVCLGSWSLPKGFVAVEARLLHSSVDPALEQATFGAPVRMEL
ncbi:MAG: hypothetical protein R3F17_08315 [Planctomycetota bacterium]